MQKVETRRKWKKQKMNRMGDGGNIREGRCGKHEEFPDIVRKYKYAVPKSTSIDVRLQQPALVHPDLARAPFYSISSYSKLCNFLAVISRSRE